MSNVKAADRPWNDPGPRSHVDTTAVQGLIDIRNIIKKWVDHPVEFHFAPILSPWIRHALVAGGFGIGIPNPGVEPDLASVAPYNESRLSSEHSKGGLEATESVKHRQSGTVEWELVVPSDTPFFHLDLRAAVRAAESVVRYATP